ncbi:MAG TPA: PLP-dependent aminotransferase family protein [Rhizomicrobium sp.]|nr:PLP-dependent aminotransferase family protein [Rhizomicrobium sp.]
MRAPDGAKTPKACSVAEIEDRLLRDIENGHCPPGSRLPSIREYARSEGASRYAVVEAYDRLVARGAAVSRPGSGFYVAQMRKRVAPAKREDRVYGVAWLIRDVLESTDDTLKAGGPWLPDSWLDVETIQSVVRSLGRGPASHLIRYGTPKGYPPLRESIQLMLAEAGIEADAEQILLTNGTSHALDIIVRHLVRRGDTVLVEDPGYYNLFGYLRLCGAKLVGVPRRADGPDLDALRTLVERHRPKLFFLQTVLQNPTASDITAHGMHRILQLASEFDFTVVEDDTYGDISNSPSPRLATLDQLDRVIYVRSFSKTLSGAIRVGLIAAGPQMTEELTNVKVLSSITTSQFNEKFIHRMLMEGHYRKYLDRVRRRLIQSRATATQILERAGLEIFIQPEGGNFLWARYPGIEDSVGVAAAARKQNIILAGGAVFRPNLEPSPYMRFNVTMCDDPRLERFLTRYRKSL